MMTVTGSNGLGRSFGASTETLTVNRAGPFQENSGAGGQKCFLSFGRLDEKDLAMMLYSASSSIVRSTYVSVHDSAFDLQPNRRPPSDCQV